LSTASTTSSSSSSSAAAIKQRVMNAEKFKLTEVINTFHENVKYLPNIPLPHNIVATSSIEAACCDATLLIFVLPHQFLNQRLLSQICNSKLHPTRCRAISLIKGIGTYRYSEYLGAVSTDLASYCITFIPYIVKTYVFWVSSYNDLFVANVDLHHECS
jgi:glycerol-3-phosphate dehydrogenase